MKHIKTFESYDGEILNGLKNLHRQMDRLSTLSSMHRRRITPNEIYEDYFLEFREIERFRVDINGMREVGPVTIDMWNILDLENIESELARYTKKLKSIKERIEYEGFDCHFSIELNGQQQSDLNPKTHRNDDYKFKGLGNKKWGYDKDSNRYSHTSVNWRDDSHKKLTDDKVAIFIKFYII